MRVIIFMLSMFMCFINTKAQTAQEFIDSCVQEAINNGVSSVIVKATFCSACEGVYEGYIFSKSDIYKVRYIKYFDGYDNTKVFSDTTLIDEDIVDIFKVAELYQDSIFGQLSTLGSLLRVKIVRDGNEMTRGALMHGKMRQLALYHCGKSVTSLHSVIDLNNTFEKAYYYWILNSIINNYINDFLRFRLIVHN